MGVTFTYDSGTIVVVVLVVVLVVAVAAEVVVVYHFGSGSLPDFGKNVVIHTPSKDHKS